MFIRCHEDIGNVVLNADLIEKLEVRTTYEHNVGKSIYAVKACINNTWHILYKSESEEHCVNYLSNLTDLLNGEWHG